MYTLLMELLIAEADKMKQTYQGSVICQGLIVSLNAFLQIVHAMSYISNVKGMYQYTINNCLQILIYSNITVKLNLNKNDQQSQ